MILIIKKTFGTFIPKSKFAKSLFRLVKKNNGQQPAILNEPSF